MVPCVDRNVSLKNNLKKMKSNASDGDALTLGDDVLVGNSEAFRPTSSR